MDVKSIVEIATVGYNPQSLEGRMTITDALTDDALTKDVAKSEDLIGKLGFLSN